jgi:hypothetical protein
MSQLFYSIKANEGGGFTYHEFVCGWGGHSAYTCGDVYKDFSTLTEAVCYAKQRGGIDAYSY